MSDLQVNYTYGIITGGVVPSTSHWYRAFYNIPGRNKSQTEAFGGLWGTRSPDSIGAGSEFIINLMRCSEYWPDYIRQYDPVNTYDNKLTTPPTSVVQTPLTYAELLRWSKGSAVPYTEKYSAKSSSIEIIIAALYNALTVK